MESSAKIQRRIGFSKTVMEAETSTTVYKNGRGSRSFHDGYRKSLWKLQASTTVLGNHSGSDVIPRRFLKNGHGIFSFHDHFLKNHRAKFTKNSDKTECCPHFFTTIPHM